jgi:hypothetical protein
MNASPVPVEVFERLAAGQLIPYLGPGMLGLVPGGTQVPATPEAVAQILTARVTVPHKIRYRLTAAAQFIENFKHRKTLVALMNEVFAAEVAPSPLHRQLAALPLLPLVVDAWYDGALQSAMAQRAGWGQAQGLSQSEHFGTWVGYFDKSGARVTEESAARWTTVLYKPLGGARPARNFLVSDTDYVEVLTEIDIQTPIPQRVRDLRTGKGFLFLGCRFNDQLQRSFARQIMKRSSDRHWAILGGALTRNEERFLVEQNIERIDMRLEEFSVALTGRSPAVVPAQV